MSQLTHPCPLTENFGYEFVNASANNFSELFNGVQIPDTRASKQVTACTPRPDVYHCTLNLLNIGDNKTTSECWTHKETANKVGLIKTTGRGLDNLLLYCDSVWRDLT